LKSIAKQINTNDYEKIKIGIGRPNSKDPEVVANYCISNIPKGILFYFKLKKCD